MKAHAGRHTAEERQRERDNILEVDNRVLDKVRGTGKNCCILSSDTFRFRHTARVPYFRATLSQSKLVLLLLLLLCVHTQQAKQNNTTKNNKNFGAIAFRLQQRLPLHPLVFVVVMLGFLLSFQLG